MTPYEMLNIEPTFTQDELKAAYRTKAHQFHPDKGGDPAVFAAVANAYDILKDPERRLLYEAGYESPKQMLENEVRNVLRSGFQAALDSEEDIEVTAFVLGNLQRSLEDIPKERERLASRKLKLEKKREKISTRDDSENIIHQLIDEELRRIDGHLLMFDRTEELTHACIEALDHYDEEWEAPKPAIKLTFNDGIFDPDNPFRTRRGWA